MQTVAKNNDFVKILPCFFKTLPLCFARLGASFNYIGYTKNIEHRRLEHLNGLVDSTKNRRPIRMIYFEAYETEQQARERESKLKDFGSAYTGLLKRLGEE